jgi:hypothetical protein
MTTKPSQAGGRACARIEAWKRRRIEPYSAVGIQRMACIRCGAKALHQWQVCADDRLFRPLCIDCDVALNALVLRWMGDPNADAKMRRYRLNMVRS